jgi:hypothetical protein
MNNTEIERNTVDYIMIATAFVGLIVGVAGVATTTIWAAIIGLLLLGCAVGYWLLTEDEPPS